MGWHRAALHDVLKDSPFSRLDLVSRRNLLIYLDGRVSSECFHLRKDGSRLWSNGALMSLHDTAGQVLGFVRILRDCSEARQTAQALEHSQAELVQALEANEKVRLALRTGSWPCCPTNCARRSCRCNC